MVKRRRGNKLARWEISVVKAMIGAGVYNDQDIQSFFTRPTRTINHARMKEIRDGTKHKAVVAASTGELQEFLSSWPNLDPETGLSAEGDELLIKSREAMIAAVHTFNGAGLTFRSEIFIVTTIIAWTYLLHAWFKREGIEYRYVKDGEVQKTKEGADKYLELGACLRHASSPVDAGTKRNLEFLLYIRHEIEHRSTSRIDDHLSAKLQATCLNFNDAIKDWFGVQYGLEKRLPIALQFVTFDPHQRAALKRASNLPPNVEASIDSFEQALTNEEYGDPAYRYRIAFVPIVKQRESAADTAIQFYKADSDEAAAINAVHLKEVDKIRHTAHQVVRLVQEGGYPNFGIGDHTRLWQNLDAKRDGTPYGKRGDYKGSWVWYDNWIDRVREHCAENGYRYT
ncbi:MAG: DUF3644 domain-containing protein [Pseudomonadota bacterium]